MSNFGLRDRISLTKFKQICLVPSLPLFRSGPHGYSEHRLYRICRPQDRQIKEGQAPCRLRRMLLNAYNTFMSFTGRFTLELRQGKNRFLCRDSWNYSTHLVTFCEDCMLKTIRIIDNLRNPLVQMRSRRTRRGAGASTCRGRTTTTSRCTPSGRGCRRLGTQLCLHILPSPRHNPSLTAMHLLGSPYQNPPGANCYLVRL